MADKVDIKPTGFHTITPALAIRDAARAIEFYVKAFGAIESPGRITMPDGKVGHAEIRIGDSILMLSDEFPDWDNLGPESLGGTAVKLAIYVEDCDAVVARAVELGATIKMPVADQFYGDRSGRIADPFGHVWIVGTHKEELSPAQIAERAKELYGAT